DRRGSSRPQPSSNAGRMTRCEHVPPWCEGNSRRRGLESLRSRISASSRYRLGRHTSQTSVPETEETCSAIGCTEEDESDASEAALRGLHQDGRRDPTSDEGGTRRLRV